MNERPPRPQRADTREVAELKELKTTQPELESAIDLQLALVDMQRRVQGRVSLPWIDVDAEWLKAQQTAGKPLVRFSDIPLDWTDFRLTFRQTADILLRFEAIERADHDAIVAIGRDGAAIEPLVREWYERTSGHETAGRAASLPPSVDQVLLLALRPFLARCAEALMDRLDVSSWKHGHCPFCGWEPDFAVITPNGDRRLVCGRCVAQWNFAPWTCPFCANDDRALVTSFATRDGKYRVYGCDVCRRYLKAYDARNAQRPALIAVDTIATLPLDAAAIQRGYLG